MLDSARSLVLVAPILLVACGVRTTPGETMGDSSSGTGGDTDAGTGGGMTSTTGAGSASGGESGGTGDDPVTTSAGGTGGDPEPDPGLAEACEAICNKFVECYPDEEPVDVCLDDCLTSNGGGPDCTELFVNLYECYASQTCAELENGDPCLEAEEAVPESCWGGGETCSVGVGGNEEGTECGMVQMCPDGTLEMQCDQQQCVCLEDGQQFASCPADAVCTNWDGLGDKSLECCGF